MELREEKMCEVGKEASIVEERPEGRVPPTVWIDLVCRSHRFGLSRFTAHLARISGFELDVRSK